MSCCAEGFLNIRNTASVDILLLKFRATCFPSFIHWTVVQWSVRKTNWLAFTKFFSSVCFWIILKTNFWNTFSIMDKRLIGHKFGGNLGSMPGFGRVMIFASFQGVGKCWSRRQRLNKLVKCTRGLLGRCRKHSFEIPSKPQALTQLNYTRLAYDISTRIAQKIPFLCCCTFVACAYIGADHAEITVPLLLFTDHYLATAVV
jgi:hypothetical protein